MALFKGSLFKGKLFKTYLFFKIEDVLVLTIFSDTLVKGSNHFTKIGEVFSIPVIEFDSYDTLLLEISKDATLLPLDTLSLIINPTNIVSVKHFESAVKVLALSGTRDG